MNLIRKAVAQLLTGLLAWATAVTVSEPAAITASEWIVAAGVLVGAFLVWLIPNETPIDVAARLAPHVQRIPILGRASAALPRDDEPTTGAPEQGAVSAAGVALVVIAVVVVLWAFGEVPR